MKDAGFTLVEVLAALAVFSFGIIGLTSAGTQSIRAVSALDQKMLAGIVADNQIIVTRRDDLRLGTRAGETQQMSRIFDYRVTTAKTEVDGFFRITAEVRLVDQEQVLVSREAYRTQDAPSVTTDTAQ